MDTRNIGLRNIEVADTKICSIDGENGKLIYRGYDILDLVNHSTFEETTYLLLFGELPDKTQLEEFSFKLKDARKLPDSVISNLKNRLKNALPMDVLQSCIPALSDFDENINSDTKEDNIRRAILLVSKIPTIVAAWNRIRGGMDVIEPDTEISHSANTIYM